MAETKQDIDNTVKPEETTSASGAVLAQAGVPDSSVKTEEQVAAVEPSTIKTENGDAVKTEDTASKTEVKNEDVKTENASPDRKRKHSEDDRDWRVRRDEQGDDRDRRGGDRDRRGGGGRGRGRGGYNDNRYKKNIKSTFDNLPETDDPDEIRKQVDFYFSDSNLLGDKYLLTQVGGSANNPVPVKMIHSFKRMRRFQPYSAVVAALRESTVVEITGTEGNEDITRKTPLPEGTTTEIDKNVEIYEDVTRSRSIYAKGFGEETESSQSAIEAFFAPYGPINAVRLRRSVPEQLFKSSVFVEFDSEETQKQFLALDPKPEFIEGKKLQIMSKEEYVVGKAKDIEDGKIRPTSPSRGGGGRDRNGDDRDRGDRRNGGGGGRGRGGRGGGRGNRGGNRGGRDDRDRRGGDRDRNNRRDRNDDDDDKPAPRAPR